jgi:hypothetical protein
VEGSGSAEFKCIVVTVAWRAAENREIYPGVSQVSGLRFKQSL